MCRMFLCHGNFGEDAGRLFLALSETAKNDPLLVKAGSTWTSHSDGWGMAMLSDGSIRFEKHSRPVYEDSVPTIISSGTVLAHARKASPGEPLGNAFSHPFYAEDERYIVLLAHNGSLDKHRIANCDPKCYDRNTDSGLFLSYIMTFPGTVKERFERAIFESLKNGVFGKLTNLLVVALDKFTMIEERLYFSHNASRSEYGDLYLVNGRGWTGVFSSSILMSAHFPAYVSKSKVENDTVMDLP
ncbi:conserved hypothetical protein [Thermoplasma acidophilum]|uniref:Glutamine amidotransferase type-2 domain-containing protein n=1 Tax=Thermoplasma acidophilum (strain ATCC 25905 / DSM 1728 / JCM 9062 / NBRC 15155 / AMRC-C165) TaxID=273075 RepID=Q9HI82_THEAC|nr:class II glutamine amidotransferase [Thermoplasma acidophilum]MCY0851330.1 class II glutamine amidotransferase [Thermoplasma acidophilum]CAC12581.1 conserved hypothetical protein [Thermoplasma acidophilum]